MNKEGEDPLKRFLKVVNHKKLQDETGVSRSTSWNYLIGRTDEMRSSSYNAIRNWILDVARQLERK